LVTLLSPLSEELEHLTLPPKEDALLLLSAPIFFTRSRRMSYVGSLISSFWKPSRDHPLSETTPFPGRRPSSVSSTFFKFFRLPTNVHLSCKKSSLFPFPPSLMAHINRFESASFCEPNAILLLKGTPSSGGSSFPLAPHAPFPIAPFAFFFVSEALTTARCLPLLHRQALSVHRDALSSHLKKIAPFYCKEIWGPLSFFRSADKLTLFFFFVSKNPAAFRTGTSGRLPEW